jgi:hypothetical protein
VPSNCQCTSGTRPCTDYGIACGTAACDGASFQWNTATCYNASTWYRDADADGYGNAGLPLSSCSQPGGYVANASDCDDARNTRSPALPETCGDGQDNNCNGQCEEGCASQAWLMDADGSGRDMLLTYDYTYTVQPILGGGGHIEETLYLYGQYKAGVTETFTLRKCLNNAGENYVEIGGYACEAGLVQDYGYPMLVGYVAYAGVASGDFCFSDCGDGAIRGGFALDRSCGSSPITCPSGASYGYGTASVGWGPPHFAAATNLCWGQ